MNVLVAIESVVIVLLAILVVGLLRSHAEILRRLHELGAGIDHDSSRRRPAGFAAGHRSSTSCPRSRRPRIGRASPALTT